MFGKPRLAFFPEHVNKCPSCGDPSELVGRRCELIANWRWRDGRVAEGDGLLNRYTGSNLYPGFESPSLRERAKTPADAGVFAFRGVAGVRCSRRRPEPAPRLVSPHRIAPRSAHLYPLRRRDPV